MITLTEVKKVFRVNKTLTSSYPRDDLERTEIVLNPDNIVLLEPAGQICGVSVTKLVIEAGGSSMTKMVEGDIGAIKSRISSSKVLLNG